MAAMQSSILSEGGEEEEGETNSEYCWNCESMRGRRRIVEIVGGGMLIGVRMCKMLVDKDWSAASGTSSRDKL
jgi:hypothetical protein